MQVQLVDDAIFVLHVTRTPMEHIHSHSKAHLCTCSMAIEHQCVLPVCRAARDYKKPVLETEVAEYDNRQLMFRPNSEQLPSARLLMVNTLASVRAAVGNDLLTLSKATSGRVRFCLWLVSYLMPLLCWKCL